MKKVPNRSGLTRRTTFVGIDVQVSRGCAYMALSEDGEELDSGWGPARASPATVARALSETLERLRARHGGTLEVGIDAPRRALSRRRGWYWVRARAAWRARRPSDRGSGRHCEVVVAALGLANPQWTPLLADAPEWMRVGFRLFSQLEEDGCRVHEVFPSASLALWAGSQEPRVTHSLAAFKPGKTDMLDALVAAATVREFAGGRGWEAPGGDGLGSLVLPSPPRAAPPASLLEWPAAGTARKKS